MALILLVEDDYTLRNALVDLLERFSHEVLTAETAEEARQLARQHPIELVLSDVRIAGDEDGVDALEGVRKHRPGVRSILMTGYADTEVPLRAARLQADDYLLKPFKMQVLLQSLRKVLSFEPEPRSFLMQMRTMPEQAANKALRWFYNQHLQQLQELREQGMKQFYLLIRSKRLTCQQAAGFFADWESLELEFLRNRSPQNWARQVVDYHGWAVRLTQLETSSNVSEFIPASLFQLYFARIQSGVLDLPQLLQAVELWHFPEMRQRSLQDYCNFHWTWGEDEDQGDPFLGLTLKGYRLLRYHSEGNQKARLYEAESEFAPQKGDRILCLPASPDSAAILRREVNARRAALLTTEHDHHFLLYPGYTMSLKHRLPGNGLLPFEAWKLLRPVFLQVIAWHKQGKVSGCFSLQDIDHPPGQPCRLTEFSPDAYRETHRALVEAEGMVQDFSAAPEVLYQAEPTPASDQAVLGRLLFEVIFGGRYPEPALRTHLRMLGNPPSNQAFAPYAERLGQVRQVFYRLAQAQPEHRFPDLEAALEAGDQAF